MTSANGTPDGANPINGTASNSGSDRSVVRVSDYEVALAQLQLSIDEKLGRQPEPILVKIANAR